MLAYNPADRITAADALNHPYFDDLDKKAVSALIWYQLKKEFMHVYKNTEYYSNNNKFILI